MKTKLFDKFKRNILIVIFCAFIGGMMLLFFLVPSKDYSSNEKRYLQQMPKFSWAALTDGSFGKDFEKYLSDQFAGRQFFVGLNSYFNLFSGRNGESGIYSGSDGYLINLPTAFDRKNIQKNIDKFNVFQETVNHKIQFMIVPSTGYIMDDKLPKLHDIYHDREILDYINDSLNDGFNFLDITENFTAEKANAQLYYKTDHHWTSKGAYLAYQNYCSAAELNETPESEYDISSYPDFYGTTYSKSALWMKQPDNIEIWQSRRPQNITVEILDSEQETKSSNCLFFEEHLNEDDKYPIYLDGNHGFVRITNKSSSGGKLLMIKDSYGQCLAPFFADNYSGIVMVDLRYYKQPVSELVQQEGFDDIFVVYGLDTFVTDSNIIWLR